MSEVDEGKRVGACPTRAEVRMELGVEERAI